MTLSWWESIVVQMAISLLSALASKITNPTEQAALQAALVFLQDLAGAKIGA